jgi:starvation-inducible DNA-binding protein
MSTTNKPSHWRQGNGRTSASTLAAPLDGQAAREIQAFGWYVSIPLALAEKVRRQSGEHLNQVLADSITLRDLYKKHHWHVSGATFYSLHLLFDRNAEQQEQLIDQIAERVMTLGGLAVAMGADVAEMTLIPRAPKGREEVPTQLSRLLHAHEIILEEARTIARIAGDAGDFGTNDLLVSDVIRTNEMQAWFLSQHLVAAPVVRGTTSENSISEGHAGQPK